MTLIKTHSTTATSHKNQLAAGALCIIAAAAAFGGMSAAIQLAAAELNNNMIVFLRNLIALIILTPIVLAQSKRHQQALVKTTRPSMHFLRGAIGLVSMYAFFYTIPLLSLPIAVLLTYSAPLFLPFIGAVWLNEKLNALTIVAGLIGFSGIALILQPDPEAAQSNWHFAGILGVFAGIGAAMAMATIRKMSDTEPTFRIVFWFALFSSIVSAIPALLTWQTPSTEGFALMLAVGVLATAGQLLITQGYHLAPASKVSVFSYSVVIFATLYSVLLGGSLPPVIFWAGFLLVCLAGVLVMLTHRPNNR